MLFRSLKKEYPVISDVRGRGLLQGFELRDTDTGTDRFVFGQALYEKMLQMGLITELESRKNLENVVVVLHPALIASKADVDQAINIIRNSFNACLG